MFIMPLKETLKSMVNVELAWRCPRQIIQEIGKMVHVTDVTYFSF
jgi:hypothetical protein